jgi:predicted acylesterase/phospholipase RssA
VGGPPRKEDVAYLSFEGGGRAALVIHPGVAQALVDLTILRYDKAARQIGVQGFAGSSSGSVLATLLSCGYTGNELCMLLSEPAFDLVFRLEPFKLGLQAKPLGRTVQKPGPFPQPASATAVLAGSALGLLDDPAGSALDMVMSLQSTIGTALTNRITQDTHRRELLTRRLAAITEQENLSPPMQALAGAATHELRDEIEAAVAQWGRDKIVAWIEEHYPHVVAKICDALLSPTSWVGLNPDNPINLVKLDYGMFAGAVWRNYFDCLVAFARFRVRYHAMLPDLRIPTDLEFLVASDVDQVFLDRIAAAATTAVYDPDTEDLPDFESDFASMRNTTFQQHRAELYPGSAPDGPPPLVLSGANLSSQESHLFSAATTPWLCVADAIRIATSLPPLFKPFVLEDADLPKDWPRTPDTFGQAPFMVGYWIDGGLYWNSPVDTFQRWETSDRVTLGVGMGIGQRVVIKNLSNFLIAMFNIVYERNISVTRTDIDRFLILDNFGITVLGPRMAKQELDYYRGYGYWQTMSFFNDQDAQ